ncbi:MULTISPECIES: ead/Ea22-like family protein [Enterobacter]|uniref:ead/Ea22-like family protein n=1 Tax=Enterobacter TaxID=547 RepID=UPI0003BF02C1|nr:MULTISPECIES: ead/Ea22-like family protein [Enterobacter]ESN31339.1 hypothetical protein L371_00016 [Enterobacter sp. MGH 25]EUM49136.1 hypothetical protein L383_01115 [Enterobacter sp. MGH 37]MDU4986705.1 hypothetical protein [Enterobacter sp.]
MSNIDKRALREAAANAKIAGEAPVMPFDQRITALNDFLKHCTPETVLVLLDEIAELEQRHCGTALLEREEMHTKTLGRMLDELEAKDSTIATQQQEIRTLLNALEQASEKRNSGLPDQKRIIGWRASDYTDETSDPELAKNWAAAIGVLPIFEGDVNTKLSAAAAAKGE